MAKIETCLGPIEESLLQYRKSTIDNANERTLVEEWWYQGVLVKRGAHVQLKQGLLGTGIVGF